MDRVWPGMIVEDNTLQVHISAVRKALGEYRDLLKTEAGRGYRLIGTWTLRGAGPSPAPPNPAPAPTPPTHSRPIYPPRRQTRSAEKLPHGRSRICCRLTASSR